MTRSRVSKRIKELQTGNSCEIHLVKQFDTSIPTYIEMSLHHHFTNKHELNEWYKLDIQDIIDFEETCGFYEDIARSMQDNPFFKYKITN